MSWSRDFVHADEVLRVAASSSSVTVGDSQFEVDAMRLPDGRVLFTLDGRQHIASAVRLDGGAIQARVDGRTYTLPVHQGGRSGTAAAATGDVTAPMTGTVLELSVSVGDSVTAGDTVAIVTAMKMEHRLVAEIDGEVVEVPVEAGANVDAGALVVRIE